jgi:hypothetical protein
MAKVIDTPQLSQHDYQSLQVNVAPTAHKKQQLSPSIDVPPHIDASTHPDRGTKTLQMYEDGSVTLGSASKDSPTRMRVAESAVVKVIDNGKQVDWTTIQLYSGSVVIAEKDLQNLTDITIFTYASNEPKQLIILQSTGGERVVNLDGLSVPATVGQILDGTVEVKPANEKIPVRDLGLVKEFRSSTSVIEAVTTAAKRNDITIKGDLFSGQSSVAFVGVRDKTGEYVVVKMNRPGTPFESSLLQEGNYLDKIRAELPEKDKKYLPQTSIIGMSVDDQPIQLQATSGDKIAPLADITRGSHKISAADVTEIFRAYIAVTTATGRAGLVNTDFQPQDIIAGVDDEGKITNPLYIDHNKLSPLTEFETLQSDLEAVKKGVLDLTSGLKSNLDAMKLILKLLALKEALQNCSDKKLVASIEATLNEVTFDITQRTFATKNDAAFIQQLEEVLPSNPKLDELKQIVVYELMTMYSAFRSLILGIRTTAIAYETQQALLLKRLTQLGLSDRQIESIEFVFNPAIIQQALAKCKSSTQVIEIRDGICDMFEHRALSVLSKKANAFPEPVSYEIVLEEDNELPAHLQRRINNVLIEPENREVALQVSSFENWSALPPDQRDLIEDFLQLIKKVSATSNTTDQRAIYTKISIISAKLSNTSPILNQLLNSSHLRPFCENMQLMLDESPTWHSMPEDLRILIRKAHQVEKDSGYIGKYDAAIFNRLPALINRVEKKIAEAIGANDQVGVMPEVVSTYSQTLETLSNLQYRLIRKKKEMEVRSQEVFSQMQNHTYFDRFPHLSGHNKTRRISSIRHYINNPYSDRRLQEN